MGFADAYLRKAGLREPVIDTDPHPDLKIIVTIPVHNESGLERCLDSLFVCNGSGDPGTPGPSDSGDGGSGINKEDESEARASLDQEPGILLPFQTEVLILVNASDKAPVSVLEQNRKTLEETRSWIAGHPHPFIGFHVWMDHSFPAKEAGVGLARKILMDEAVRRFSSMRNPGGHPVGNPNGIIASLDADVVVDPNYLEALVRHFETLQPDGCSIYFEHPLSPESTEPFETFEPGVYEAITQYELHLRYYLNAVRSTGYPYAFHTVGSSFSVRADVYCKEGGMNKRQGGEDFYFIQKVAQRGNFSECNTTRVLASPRPSNRVPFGTGPVVEKYIREQAMLNRDHTQHPGDQVQHPGDQPRLTTYHPEPFRMLGGFFSEIDSLYSETTPGSDSESTTGLTTGSAIQIQQPVLSDFLETQDFNNALKEIRGNSASLPAFRKRFWRWFNMFRIMKFLHYAREHGYPDMAIDSASKSLLTLIKSDPFLKSDHDQENELLLIFYRGIDRYSL